MAPNFNITRKQRDMILKLNYKETITIISAYEYSIFAASESS